MQQKKLKREIWIWNSVRHIGNKFLNCSEMSEQECAYSPLELPITQSSIKVEFINTSEIHNRVFIAKPDYMLQKNEDITKQSSHTHNLNELFPIKK